MTRRTRRNHSAAFKTQVALAALKADKTLSELSSEFDVHQNQIIDWRNQLQTHIHSAFDGKAAAKTMVDLKPYEAKIGRLTLENDFLESALIKAGLLSAKR
jgi:transposase-like protein